jgi:hypothetical protein
MRWVSPNATLERNAVPLTDYTRSVEDGDDFEIFEQR